MKWLIFFALTGTLLLNTCMVPEVRKKLDERIEMMGKMVADQHFKTSLAMIELHEKRFGTYPENLDALRFTGFLDSIAIAAVEYTKWDTGYELNLKDEMLKRAGNLSYPKEFWNGLGVQKSNLRFKW